MKKLVDHILGTYTSMRLTLCVLGFIMPLVLMWGGRLRANIPAPTHSMSAYYHLNNAPKKVKAPDTGTYHNDYSEMPEGTPTPKSLGTMRDCFVGFLFAIGVLLFSYKGYSVKEDWALNIGGVAAWLVAIFHMDWPPVDIPGFSLGMHGGSATLLFLCIAYVCIFRSCDTLVDDAKKAKFQKWYRILGWSMGLFPIIAWILNSLIGSKDTWTFWLEATGVWIFAAYWAVKTYELWDGQVEAQVLRGELVHKEGYAPLLKTSTLQRVVK